MPLSNALWRARLGRHMSRRRALQAMGLGAAGLAGAALLGCGDDEEEAAPTATPSPPSPTDVTFSPVLPNAVILRLVSNIDSSAWFFLGIAVYPTGLFFPISSFRNSPSW